MCWSSTDFVPFYILIYLFINEQYVKKNLKKSNLRARNIFCNLFYCK